MTKNNENFDSEAFKAAAAQDSQLQTFRMEVARYASRLAILSEQVSLQHASAKALDAVKDWHDRHLTDAQKREAYLKDIWQQTRGDVGAFTRTVEMRDWQTIAEESTDSEERERALAYFHETRIDLDAYLYDPNYQEPVDPSD